ncbi:MAG: PfkB family carbohydrate kinase [Paratractidigestivibacter faecalis]|uniref:PfkB family carbohydrate kinase n=1 Tax=Paratractidigestivibacter faecalis TaxID=2292441 RepID=UPI0026F0928F|nr:PfkB family carbohydrate kinase [Paratractidigestivibacter faecalis]MCI6506802.1 PfkB family carbohydrate kinase [Olsenella sp.]MDD6417827.1 PfkB family carbohydrate kinase [Paratractidigestivibacter faecalis]MDY6013718.1 PfkB family carbohydrate kinase [Paratractidigestivibacter faecalis]
MNNTQLLLINDMCGYGKVALSAMLPVLSHMGYRIHNLPTALVSDTLNYPKFYIHDTTEYVRQSLAIWEELGFEFDAISTGFIVTEEETRIISDFCHRRAAKGTKVFVDPIMGDNGRLYAGVPESTIGLMRDLVACADYTVPNYTEACLLTDTPMREGITAEEAHALVDAVRELGAKSVVVTSANVDGKSAVIGYDHVASEHFSIPFELIPVYFPGTGDTFSSVLLGRVMAGWTLQRATADAMRVVSELIARNASQQDKSAGLPIEACLDVIDCE